MNNTKIGWIGLGMMGNPMSQKLIKAGFPVTVYNRTKAKENTITALGASAASTPLELIKLVDVVFIMVSDDDAIKALFYGNDGLLKANLTGKIMINMSTVSPDISKEVALKCSEQGNHYLDAPVSGSVKQAQDGQLVIMVGGDDKIFEQIKPILEKIGKLAMLVGDTGAGNIAKLSINTLLAFAAQGLAEAVVLARNNGIDTHDLITLINNSALGSPFGKIKGEAIVNDNYAAAFALKLIAKDLRLAKNIGLSTPLAQTAYETFQNAEAKFGNEDIIAIIKQIAEK